MTPNFRLRTLVVLFARVLLFDLVLRRVRVGRAAGDRLALVVVGVVDLLAVDLDRPVLVAPQAGRPEVLLGALLVTVVALAAAERLVLALVVGPVLEVLGGSSSRSLRLSPSGMRIDSSGSCLPRRYPEGDGPRPPNRVVLGSARSGRGRRPSPVGRRAA